MIKEERKNIIMFFNKMSKKGFHPILLYIKNHENMHYNEVLQYAIKNKVVSSRATITIILNELTGIGVLERTVSQNRPIRTTYKVSNKGQLVIKHMNEIESVI